MDIYRVPSARRDHRSCAVEAINIFTSPVWLMIIYRRREETKQSWFQ